MPDELAIKLFHSGDDNRNDLAILDRTVRVFALIDNFRKNFFNFLGNEADFMLISEALSARIAFIPVIEHWIQLIHNAQSMSDRFDIGFQSTIGHSRVIDPSTILIELK